MNAEEFLGTNPYGDLDKQSNPLIVGRVLDSITVTPPENHPFYQDDPVDNSYYNQITVTANYSNGDSEEVPIYKCTVQGFTTEQVGTYVVTVWYSENGITKEDSFEVEVLPKPANVIDVNWYYYDYYYEGVFYEGAKHEYYVGDVFSAAGVKAIACSTISIL